MKVIDIESFTNLEDADDWLYSKFELAELVSDEIKGEIVKIDGKFRVSIMTDYRQGELNFG